MAQERYGVHSQTLESQWDKETTKSANIGSKDPYNVLKGKKLDAYEQICISLNIAPSSKKVSSTGDMGPMQFQPQTWLAYGLDGDGDGKADPWNLQDAVLSSANYLNKLGYSESPWTALTKYNGGYKYCGSTRAQKYAATILKSANDNGAQIEL